MKFKEKLIKFWEGSFGQLDFQYILMPIILALFAGGVITLMILSNVTRTGSFINPYNAFWLFPLFFMIFFIVSFSVTNFSWSGC